jgi:GNAT superfamily N-acetyltransferase
VTIQVREARPDDAQRCGRICYEAFHAINEAHGFPPDIPSPELGIGLLSMMIGHPGHHVIVAERDGVVLGSNALDERSEIAGIGPITVDPELQNSGVGRLLMDASIERAKRFDGVRLVQAAFHNRSLSLYTKLGFDPREPLSCVSGPPLERQLPGYSVRPAIATDLADCDALCHRVHGHTRSGELADAIRNGSAQIAVRGGRIVAYCTGIAFFSHAVGEGDADVQALIAAAPAFHGPGFLVPTRNAALLRWCLEQGLRIVQPMTLMSMGRYQEPRGAWLASILY